MKNFLYPLPVVFCMVTVAVFTFSVTTAYAQLTPPILDKTDVQFAVLGNGSAELVNPLEDFEGAASAGLRFLFSPKPFTRLTMLGAISTGAGLSEISRSDFVPEVIVFPETGDLSGQVGASFQIKAWTDDGADDAKKDESGGGEGTNGDQPGGEGTNGDQPGGEGTNGDQPGGDKDADSGKTVTGHRPWGSLSLFGDIAYQKRKVIDDAVDDVADSADLSFLVEAANFNIGLSGMLYTQSVDTQNQAAVQLAIFYTGLNVADRTVADFNSLFEGESNEHGSYHGVGVKLNLQLNNAFVEITYKHLTGDDYGEAAIAGSRINVRTGVIGKIMSW